MTKPKVKTIDVHELKKRRDVEPNLCLIDVREPHEWEALRIPGALHIPKDQLTHSIKGLISDHEKAIYLHCKAGARSLYAADCLIDLGYKEVYSVDGGIAEWLMFGYPVEE